MSKHRRLSVYLRYLLGRYWWWYLVVVVVVTLQEFWIWLRWGN